MGILAPNRSAKGAWLGLTLSRAAIELDSAIQERPRGYESAEKIRVLLQEHYDKTRTQGALDYSSDGALREALIFEVVPKIFSMTPKNCKKYRLEDYLAGLGLVLEQFKNIEQADTKRLEFLRGFMVDLGNYRLERLEPNRGYIAA